MTVVTDVDDGAHWENTTDSNTKQTVLTEAVSKSNIFAFLEYIETQICYFLHASG